MEQLLVLRDVFVDEFSNKDTPSTLKNLEAYPTDKSTEKINEKQFDTPVNKIENDSSDTSNGNIGCSGVDLGNGIILNTYCHGLPDISSDENI